MNNKLKSWAIYLATTLTFLLLLSCCLYAQKNDYMWLQGYDSYGGYDAHLGLYFGNPVMNFNYSPVQITTAKFSRDETVVQFFVRVRGVFTRYGRFEAA